MADTITTSTWAYPIPTVSSTTSWATNLTTTTSVGNTDYTRWVKVEPTSWDGLTNWAIQYESPSVYEPNTIKVNRRKFTPVSESPPDMDEFDRLLEDLS